MSLKCAAAFVTAGHCHSKSGDSLPSDVQRDSALRFTVALWITAAIHVLYLTLYSTLFASSGHNVGRLISTGMILFTLALIFALRRWRLSPHAVGVLGIVFEALLCFSLGFTDYYGVGKHAYVAPPDTISWVCVVMVLFPWLNPGTQRQALVASLLAASAHAAAYFTVAFMGHFDHSLSVDLALLMPPFICALIAILPARVIHRLGHDLKAARRLGSYELVEKLGQGGMGEVWRAKHQLLTRPAAVKLIRPSKDPEGQADAIARFEEEVQITATLRSPHTVEVYDFGVTAEGDFYYIMEMLDGVDLERLVQEYGPLPPARVAHLAMQICDSLDEAHRLGVVHRDIKPANIFICHGGALDFVKVLDFGLVKHLESSPRGDLGLTGDAHFLGTPAYLSPEMIVGERKLDGRSDLYALGCVMFFALTGERLFDSKRFIEVLTRHANEPPVAPSTRVEAPIPEALDAVILDCLAKDPADRPEDAEALRRRLEEIVFEAPWSREDARGWWARRPPPASWAPR